MTERDPVHGAPGKLPVDLLADLDAGVLDPAEAARVRAVAQEDPHAGAVLAGLAATRAELGDLADPPVPPEFAARWDAALATEAGASSTGAPAPARPGRIGRAVGRTHAPRRRLRPALVAAAVLAAAVVAGVLGGPREPDPQSLDGVDLVTAGLAVRGDMDVGDLADPVRRAGCLRAVAPPGVAPEAPLLGGRDVVVTGRPGVLLLLATGQGSPRMHVVVVDPGCGPQGGELLRVQAIGG
jgi:hypothetical protein